MTQAAQHAVPVSPILVGASGLVAGVAVAASLVPSLASRWLALGQRCLAADGGTGPEIAHVRQTTAAGVIGDAWVLVAMTLGPPLLASLCAALCAGVLQALAGRRERPESRSGSDAGRPPRSPGLGSLLAVLGVTVGASVLAVRQEQHALHATLVHGAGSSLAAVGMMAARVALRVGVVLIAAGLVDHLLGRLRLKAAWRAEQGQRGRRDGEADPRLRGELRRRQRSAG